MIEVAMLWLRNGSNELLLARRADNKSHDPGLWGPSMTGKVEPGESFRVALKRETLEELSLPPETYEPEYLFCADFTHPDGIVRRFEVYIASIDEAAASRIVFDTSEVAEVCWMTADSIKAMLATNGEQMVVASAHKLWARIFKAIES